MEPVGNSGLPHPQSQYLIQRLGELRFLRGDDRISVDSNGKAVLPAPPEETYPTIGTWVRGFGNGMHFNDQVSRAFDQNTGGFQLGGDQVRATRRAACLGVVVGEQHAFFGELVEVRRLAGHHAPVIGTDVPHADVVTHDDDADNLVASFVVVILQDVFRHNLGKICSVSSSF